MIHHFKYSILRTSLILFILTAAIPKVSNSSDKILQHIPDVLISLESGNAIEYAILVEKQTQRLSLLSFDGTYRKLFSFNCSTGEVAGKKEKSGDKKTPEGIYFFTSSFEKKYLSAIYGDRAFPMDYPNLMDKIKGHDGNSIWMHGSDKPIKARNSNGCIVLANDNINTLANYIRLHETPIIVAKQFSFVSTKTSIEIKNSLKHFIKKWSHTLNRGSYEEYISFYNPEYVTQIKWWPEWNILNNFLRESESSFSIILDPVSIFKSDGIYVARFNQIIRVKGHNDLPAGSRKLFLIYKNDTFRIIGDEYQVDKKKNNPLITACRNLKIYLDAEHEISELLKKWITAWSSKDIETYGNCYASDFRFKKQDRSAWLRKKRRLNKKYNYINIRKENLTIKRGEDISVATFTQFYESSGYSAVGNKKLLLKREDGQWKIFRETWKKI